MKDALELLLYSFDHELSEKEKKQLKNALKNSAELRAEKERYLEMRKNISDISAPEFPYFKEGIMAKWEAKNSTNNFGTQVVRMFPRVAAIAALFILITWSVIYFSGDNFSTENLVVIDDLSPDEAYSLLEF